MTDSAEFVRNCNKHSFEEIRRYAGMNIAWSGDGTQILAAAHGLDELFAEMDRRGITDYVVDFTPTMIEPASNGNPGGGMDSADKERLRESV
jgi:hypothetical protein